MENLQLRQRFDTATFRNKKDVCILEVRNETNETTFRLTKGDAIDIIKHLQEWVGIKDQTGERQSIIPEVRRSALTAKDNFKKAYLVDAFYWVNEANHLKLQEIFQEFGIKCFVGQGYINWHDGFKNLVTFQPDRFHDYEFYQKTDFWHHGAIYGEPKDYELMLKAYEALS